MIWILQAEELLTVHFDWWSMSALDILEIKEKQQNFQDMRTEGHCREHVSETGHTHWLPVEIQTHGEPERGNPQNFATPGKDTGTPCGSDIPERWTAASTRELLLRADQYHTRNMEWKKPEGDSIHTKSMTHTSIQGQFKKFMQNEIPSMNLFWCDFFFNLGIFFSS